MLEHAAHQSNEILAFVYNTAAELRANQELRRIAAIPQPQILPTLKSSVHNFPYDRQQMYMIKRHSSSNVRLVKNKPLMNKVRQQSGTARILYFLESYKKQEKQMAKEEVKIKNAQKQTIEEQFIPIGVVRQQLQRRSEQSQMADESVSRSRLSRGTDSLVSHSRLSKLTANVEDKKYLRKGSRVRELLMRRLTPDPSVSSSSKEMAYVKEYDQWVPAVLVEERKRDLQGIMAILYGDKKANTDAAIDIYAAPLIYL